MRRLTFLLCLLMVVVLRWTIVSAAALTTTGRNEPVLPKTGLTLEAVNTGFKASLVAVAIRAEDTVWITHELLSAGTDARAYSTIAILSDQNRRVRFELIGIAAGMMIEISLQPGIGPIGLDESIFNFA